MAELVDAHGSGPCTARCEGSSPFLGTKFRPRSQNDRGFCFSGVQVFACATRKRYGSLTSGLIHPPYRGREVLFGRLACIVPHEWSSTSPSIGEAGWGVGRHIPNPRLTHLIPTPKTRRILPPSPLPGGLQANSGWGEPGGGFASPTGSKAVATGLLTPRTVQFQKPAPRDDLRLIFLLRTRRKPSRGPPNHDNRDQAVLPHARQFMLQNAVVTYQAFFISSLTAANMAVTTGR
jgi:hypothetical protein